MSITDSDLQSMYLAYRLGCLSGSNLKLEARSASPRLFKLIGHASLFDNARRYINEHNCSPEQDDESVTEVAQTVADHEKDDECPTVECIEDIDTDAAIIDLLSTANPSAPLKTLHLDEETHLNQPDACLGSTDSNTTASMAWDEESNCSTDEDDQDEDSWSDSTYDEDYDYYHSEDHQIFDAYPVKYVGSGMCSTKVLDDDAVLWSQQPRVMSFRQVEDLFAETFG